MTPGTIGCIAGTVSAKGAEINGSRYNSERLGTGHYKVTLTPNSPFEYYAAPNVTSIEPGAATEVSLLKVGLESFEVKFTLIAALIPADTAFAFAVSGE